MIHFREYAHGSPDYAGAVELRHEVLRRPLGLTFDPADLAAESSDIHVGGFEGSSLVATLTFTPHGEVVHMRQVAVAPDRQGQGIGGNLVEFSEARVLAAGFKKVILHARVTVVPFYERLGYSCVGDPFEEVTIPHQAMEKWLCD